MLEANCEFLKDRWSYYYKVFEKFPLLGFPNYVNWNRVQWYEDLYNFSYSDNPDSSIHKLRDLQIIRPRMFGTVEFRSDSSQSNIDSILNLSALRLGQFLLAAEGKNLQLPSYSEACRLWKEQLESGSYKNEDKKK